MSARDIAAVILAAGKGTRMKSAVPKVLHPVAGLPMVAHVVHAVGSLSPARVIVVVGPGQDDVASAVAGCRVVEQPAQLGTADAVKAARGALDGLAGDVLVLYGDTPLITAETLGRMIAARREAGDPAVVVLGFRPPDPGLYGRLVTAPDGRLERIVEARDATAEERAIGLCNSGVMAIDGALLFTLIDGVDNRNAKGEYYLTDIVGLARRAGRDCAVVEADAAELLGLDSRFQLAEGERAMQDRLRRRAMDEGATLVDPPSVHLHHDTVLGRDVRIEPNVFFGPGVTVEDDVHIRSFSHLEGVVVRRGAQIGPFARLRPGADIGAGAHIGNFVEIKNATVEAGAKANHLSYIGDARVGAGANVGAGTITCNYDGFVKSHTDIGAGAFIGSNTSLVAPVAVGDGAIIGAGSVVTQDVPADAIAVERSPLSVTAGAARPYRARRKAAKAARQGGN